jgi:hypothetical protein
VLAWAFVLGSKAKARVTVTPPPVETVDQYLERLNGSTLLLPRGQA